MGTTKTEELAKVEISSLADRLNKEYYMVAEKLCAGAKNNISLLLELEASQTPTQYITSCNALVTEVGAFITTRRKHFIPYILELGEKSEASHDCATCSGKCQAGHNIKLAEFKESNARIKDLPARLQMMSLPFHGDTEHPEVYRTLRNHMVLLGIVLTELSFLEETYLVPKIEEAQKNINAHG